MLRIRVRLRQYWKNSINGHWFMAQLVEQLLLIPEVRGSNQVISKNLFKFNVCLLSTVNWKDENKDKEAGNGPFFKKKFYLLTCLPHLHASNARRVNGPSCWNCKCVRWYVSWKIGQVNAFRVQNLARMSPKSCISDPNSELSTLILHE